MSDTHMERAQALDAELAKVAGKIRVLEKLAWPAKAESRFLEAWRAGRRELPDVHLEPVDHTVARERLDSIATRCERAHPLSNLVYKTARSYVAATRMLGGIGTPEFTRWSIVLYGRPDDRYETQDWTGVDAAQFFLDKTDDLCGGRVIPETEATIPARRFAKTLRHAVDDFFVDDDVEVVLDAKFASKAIAGSKRIRLRKSALFSELDHQQLLQHEAFVHSATMLVRALQRQRQEAAQREVPRGARFDLGGVRFDNFVAFDEQQVAREPA